MWHQQDSKIRSSGDFPLKTYWFSNNTWANSFMPNPESSWEVSEPWWAQNQLHSSWWEKFWPLLTIIHQPGTASPNREETPIFSLEKEKEDWTTCLMICFLPLTTMWTVGLPCMIYYVEVIYFYSYFVKCVSWNVQL